jgi:hypothetical protein
LSKSSKTRNSWLCLNFFIKTFDWSSCNWLWYCKQLVGWLSVHYTNLEPWGKKRANALL